MSYRSVYALSGLLFATTVFLSHASAQAQDIKRESLRGIKAVAVVTELPLARKVLISMVDGFISDYSAVNPL